MRRTTVLLGIMLSVPSLACTRTESADLAITNVTVIDVTGARAPSSATVLITGTRISKIDRSRRTKLADGVQVIDGTGKFVIPGLWDMHMHMSSKQYLALFVANGVTSIRVMAAFKGESELRDEVSAGRLTGPRMTVASPVAYGREPGWTGSFGAITNEEEGRQLVRKAKNDGADFVKVDSYLPRNAYFAIVDEAKKQGIPVAGHVPYSVNGAEVSDAGQRSIEHKYGVIIPCSKREEAIGKTFMEELIPTPVARVRLLAAIDYSEEKAATLFARFVKNRTFVCPTLVVWSELSLRDRADLSKDPRLRFMMPDRSDGWIRQSSQLADAEALADLRTLQRKALDIVRAMAHAGVELLAGTDTPMPYCYPGFGLHDELALFVQAGLSPMEALRTATYNPAKFLGKLDSMGTVEEGKVADLVMLDANPLEDIRNTRKIAAVVVGGKILQRAELAKMLAEVEAATDKSKKK